MGIDWEQLADLVRASRDRAPVSVQEARDGITGPGPFLVATGQYAPDPSNAVRVGVLRGSEVLADVWLTPAGRDALVAELRRTAAVREGEWDVMYATGWGLAWTTDGDGPFEAWDAEGRLAWQEGGALVVRPDTRVDGAEIDHIHAYLDEGWVLRGVRAVLQGGRTVKIAEVRDEISTIDPTYDGLNIMCEAAWAVSLAGAIARAFGVAMERDEPL